MSLCLQRTLLVLVVGAALGRPVLPQGLPAQKSAPLSLSFEVGLPAGGRAAEVSHARWHPKEKACILRQPGRSALTWRPRKWLPDDKRWHLLLEHREGGDGCRVEVTINGSKVAQGLRPAGRAWSRDILSITKFLRTGLDRNEVTLRLESGKSYVLRRVELHPNLMRPRPLRTLGGADFSRGSYIGTLRLDIDYGDISPVARDCLALGRGGRLAGRFELQDRPPRRAWLILDHLSAGLNGAPFKGCSPISIRINGRMVCEALDPGATGFTFSRLEITGLLGKGRNSLEIRSLQGPSEYWLRRLVLAAPASRATGRVP